MHDLVEPLGHGHTGYIRLWDRWSTIHSRSETVEQVGPMEALAGWWLMMGQ